MRNGIFSAQGSKDSAVLFVAGDNKMKDHTNRTNTIRRAHKMFMALLIALTMMISSAVPGVSAFAANNNDTVRVATYDQLQEALEETKGVKEIVVDPQAAVDEGEVVYSVEGDENNNAFYIGFDEALTVSDDITITSADDVDVYFARSDSFRNDQDKPALLNIESEGKLNLDGFITMTGEEVATTFYEANEVNPAEFVFSVKSKDGTGEDNEVWNSDQALKGGFYIQNNGGEYTLGDDVVMKDINLADDVEDAEQIHEEEKTTSADEEEVVEEKSADAAEEEVKAATEEATQEETTQEEEVVVAPTPKRLMKNSLMSTTPTRGTTPITTFSDLKTALANGTSPIVLDATFTKDGKNYFPISEPLTVNNNVVIQTKDNKEIIFARSDKFKPEAETPAMFNVVSGGDLTLSNQVVMSGIEVKMPEKVNVKLSTGNAYLGIGKYGVMDQLKAVSSGAKEFSVNNGGFLTYYDGTKTCTFRYNFLTSDQNNAGEQDFRVKAVKKDGTLEEGYVTSLEEGKTYVAVVKILKHRPDNTTYYEENFMTSDGNSLSISTNRNNAVTFTATPSGGQNNVNYVVNPKTGNEAWTKEEVKEGGYFIHATNGGKVTINNNVYLQDIKTTADVEKAAPVYIGSGSVFTMNGGFIQGNTIGYAAVDPTVEAKSDKAVVQYSGDPNGGVRQFVRGKDMTNTAGGIIFDGQNTEGYIYGGSITKNQADVGGILVKNGATVTFGTDGSTSITNPSIDNNIGFHHAGAVQVESGGTVTMWSGQLSENVAWHRGGAVWATEFGTTGYVDSKANPGNRHDGGNFIMNGGYVSNNFAFVRGGGINVESNGVILNGGDITGNKCKSLGGAIYVEGDTPNYSYTLVIKNGDIRNNKAVGAKKDGDLDKKLVNNELKPGSDYARSGHHNDDDFAGNGSGNGGGVWLCPMGGTSIFATRESTSPEDPGARVNIFGNSADVKGGDFYLHGGKGYALLQNLSGFWKSGSTEIGTIPAEGKVFSGPMGMWNATDDLQNTGIKIYGNRSRNGGAIAANGTVVLGETQHVYRFETELELEKNWADELKAAGVTEPVTIELKYLYNGTPYTLKGADAKEYKITVDIDNLAGGEEGDVIFRDGQWKAKALLPPVIYHEGNPNQPVELYRILKGDGTDINNYYNLSTVKGIEDLYNDLGDNGGSLKVHWSDNFIISETANGIGKTYKVTQVADPEAVITKKTNDGAGDIKVHFSSITIGQTIKNTLNTTDVTLKKTDLDAPAKGLKGAEFTLYKAGVANYMFVKGSRDADGTENQNKVSTADIKKTATSGDNGQIKFEKLTPGPYLLFETKVAPGYEVPKSPWFMFIDNAGQVSVTKMKDSIQGKLKVGNDMIDNYPYDPANLDTWVLNKYWAKDWFKVTSESWTIVNDAHQNAKDTDVEVSESVTADDAGEIIILNGNPKTANITLTNELFKLYKYNDDKSTVLGGTRFIMYGATVDGSKTKLTRGKNQTGGSGAFVTSNSSNGLIDISSLIKLAISSSQGTDPGKNITALSGKRLLLLYEDEPKDGYIKPKTPWLIVMNENSNEILEVREYKDRNSDDTVWDYADFNKVIWAYNGSSDNIRTSTIGDRMLTNTKVYNLPKAGGMGTYWFMIIGAMMMGFALTAGFTKMNLLKLLRR